MGKKFFEECYGLGLLHFLLRNNRNNNNRSVDSCGWMVTWWSALPSGGSISCFPRGKIILGRNRETQRTEQDSSVTFWQVVMDILSQITAVMCLCRLRTKNQFLQISLLVTFLPRLEEINPMRSNAFRNIQHAKLKGFLCEIYDNILLNMNRKSNLK